MLVLPNADYQRLEKSEITVDEYIETSHFNYGFLWGGGGLISGAYWQPLEDVPGIHDTNRISRYLRILSCRTGTRSHGHSPTAERCQKCQLDETGCPYSPLNQTGCWDNEIQEPDGRVELFNAIGERLEKELGFKIGNVMSHSNDSGELLLFPGFEPNSVQAYVNKDLLNDLLYHPKEERDWMAMAQSFKITLGISWQPDRMAMDDDTSDKHEFCLGFWGDKMPKAETQEPTDELDEADSKKTSPFAFMLKLFLGK